MRLAAALNADPPILFTRSRRRVAGTTGLSESRTGTSNRHRQHHKHSYRKHQDNALHYFHLLSCAQPASFPTFLQNQTDYLPRKGETEKKRAKFTLKHPAVIRGITIGHQRERTGGEVSLLRLRAGSADSLGIVLGLGA